MNNIIQKIIVFGLILLTLNTQGQTLNWQGIENTKHILSVGIGLDYSLGYQLNYGQKLKSKVPIVINVNISAPAGEHVLDDFKTKIGGQFLVLNHGKLKASLTINGLYRRYENPLVVLQNFGSETNASLGFYGKKLFFAAEIGFDKAIVTNLKHNETFKENIYADVKDGWYQPSTGGNFKYGIQMGVSFRQSDITLNVGKVTTQNFKDTPLIPYYLYLSYNLKIKPKQ